MANRHVAGNARWVLVAAIIGALAAPALVVRQAAAGELRQLDTSLKLIPRDATFYSSMLRNREQFEAIAKSRAWAKIKEMPIVQMGIMSYKMQAMNPQTVPGQIETALKDPENRKLIDMVADMLSDEIFLYGDQSWVGFLELVQQVFGAMRYGPAMMQLTGQSHAIDEDDLQAMLLLAALSENLDLLKVPNVIVGFKLRDKDRAAEQLEKLHALATAMLEANPLMKGRFKRAKVAGHEYLTLSLDGEMIPWDERPLDKLKDLESDEGDVEKLIARLKKTTLVVALGVRDEHLLLSIGSSTDCLARLGKGGLLIDRPELKPLGKFVDKRLTSIGYVSKLMMARIGSSKQDIDDLREVVNELLPLAELKPEQEAQIRKDAAELAQDLKGLIPEPGAVMALSFLTDRGIEGYQYNWGEHSGLDGSKPLSLLKHVGGNPFLAFVNRGKTSPENYDLLVKWFKVGWRYVEDYAVPQIPKEEREKFDTFVELTRPLLKRVDKANRTMLIPALADGQAALVLDSKLKSKHFIEALPATDQPMPMIEPAIVVGVSDVKLLRSAFGEYRAALDGLVDAIRRIEPDAIPADYKIPGAEVTKSPSGTIWGWSLPQQWGVDKKIVPNFGLSDTVGVLSISRNHTRRLLKATPLAAGGVLAKADRPLAVAVVFDFAALIDAATPWVNLAVDKINQQRGADEDEAAAIVAQVQTALEVLKVLRTFTSESYLEGNALVTHTLMEIRDVPQ